MSAVSKVGIEFRATGAQDAAARKLFGFEIMWLRYVTGFNPVHHCAACLRGSYRKGFFSEMPIGTGITYRVDDSKSPYRAMYLCGVSRGFRWSNNLHIPFVPAAGEVIREVTYNGIEILIANARRLPIPPLPGGWRSYSNRFTTCRNFQFAVDFFGADNEKADSRPWFMPNPGDAAKSAQRLMF